MIDFHNSYTTAERFGLAGSYVFYLVTTISMALLVWPQPQVALWLHPLLVIAIAASLTCSAAATFFQTRGNSLGRESLLGDGLGLRMGARLPPGYYSNGILPSLRRLAANTLANTVFTGDVLQTMVFRQRIKAAAWLGIMVFLMAFRSVSTDWVILLVQAVFSGNVLLSWVRLERYRDRVGRVHQRLRDFFLRQAGPETVEETAIILASFADYEAAKDEAAMPLDRGLFVKRDAALSKEWSELRERLSIPHPGLDQG